MLPETISLTVACGTALAGVSKAADAVVDVELPPPQAESAINTIADTRRDDKPNDSRH
jgi:hypothetical protein